MPSLSLDTAPEYAIGLQPVIEAAGTLVGFEILCHGNAGQLPVATPFRPIPARIIGDLIERHRLSDVLSHYWGWLKVSNSTLLSDVMDRVPVGRFVLEVQIASWNMAVAARCDEMRARGHRIACWTPAQDLRYALALQPAADAMKISLRGLSREEMADCIGAMRGTALPLAVEGVEDPSIARQLIAQGCAHIQGMYLAAPASASGRPASDQPSSGLPASDLPASGRPTPGRPTSGIPTSTDDTPLLHLISAVIANADVSEITALMMVQPRLCAKLLELINTSRDPSAKPITSLALAVATLNREHLRKWLLMLAFLRDGRDGGCAPYPRLILAATRARMMELLVRQFDAVSDIAPDTAFQLGMLSVMSAEFERGIEALAATLRLDAPLTAALLVRGGTLGSLLLLVEQVEQPDFPTGGPWLEPLQEVDMAILVELQLAASRWANALGASGRTFDPADEARRPVKAPARRIPG